MSGVLDAVLGRVDSELDASLERLKDLLRIPSISTDPQYRDDTRRAAEWCRDQLAGLGFDATAHATTGHPMVVAHHEGPGEGPHLLYYGHYDVQPPDPLELWDSDPFDPQIVASPHGQRIVGRGTADDKGQLMTFVEAFRAWHAETGSLPIRVTVLLEGEEESGSPSLDPFLTEHRNMLNADAAVICDTGMWDIETPAITYMLRGLVYVEITLHGPAHDLHSGMYGGAVVNPLNALARILGELHGEERRIQIPGFYDDVRDLSQAERAQWASLGFDESAFLGSAGLTDSMGESDRTVLERVWARPTCDLNGVWGGYTGDGAKTVIPSHANAKLSCRLVADQDPKRVYDGIVQFLNARTPPGCRWEVVSHGVSPAIRVPTESPYLVAAMEGLKGTFDRDAMLIGCGGSIPVVGSFQRILGMESLLVGFSLDDDRVHSPNEKFEVRCFEQGVRAHARMLDAFAGVRAEGVAGGT